MLFALIAPFLLAPPALAGVHRFPVKRLPRPAAADFAGEGAAVAAKYGAQRPFPPQSRFGADKEADDLYWTQQGGRGHSVPLNSKQTHPLSNSDPV
jgi:hypothetical protein